MNATINISLPKSMYADAQKSLGVRGYASISELIRDALRRLLYPQVTENGLTPEFEEAVLRSEAQPRKDDYVLKTDKEVEDYFLRLKLPKKRGKKR
ncbi:hypothetical protein HY086_05430 [Candidatus Gottesmanbacteria bacterium]|nr:hypothetical protein [Candidatus Gottesmanbacteria bacterium]